MSVFDFIFTWPPWWCHVHHPPSLLRQFWGKLRNASPTCFTVKQAARSLCMSHIVLLLLDLWCNWKIITRLVLRPKPKNRCGDFEAQITKLKLRVLRPKLRNPSTLVLRLNQETRAPRFLMHGVERTQRHPTSWWVDHRVPDLCLTFPSPLHQVSYSCLDPCRCLPWSTCDLHMMRQVNTILHTR
jgi:hypothetical protein